MGGSWSTELAAVEIETLQGNDVECSDGPNFAENRASVQEAQNEEPRPGNQDDQGC